MPGKGPHELPTEHLKYITTNSKNRNHTNRSAFLGHLGFDRKNCRSAFLNVSNETITCACDTCKKATIKQVITPGSFVEQPKFKSSVYRNYQFPPSVRDLTQATFGKNIKSVFSQTKSGLVSWQCADYHELICTCVLCRHKVIDTHEEFVCQPADPNDVDKVDC